MASVGPIDFPFVRTCKPCINTAPYSCSMFTVKWKVLQVKVNQHEGSHGHTFINYVQQGYTRDRRQAPCLCVQVETTDSGRRVVRWLIDRVAKA